MIDSKDIKIFIDPSSTNYYRGVLFDESNDYYNRDNCLTPFIYLKKFLENKGYEVFTADYLLNGEKSGRMNIYISIGMMENYKILLRRKNIVLSSFFIFEPPVVAPKLYKRIKDLSKYFRKVFVHTTGRDLEEYINGVKNIAKFYWPQIEDNVIEDLWKNKERKFLTLINSNKKPNIKANELYSERIKAIKFFSKYGEIDLYGFNWDRYIFYLPYWFARREILRSYRGTVKSKYETLSKYNFAICFENMKLSGYITEKIFDCFFVGTVPIYWGAPNIEKYIPADCFIDMRKFNNYSELRKFLRGLSSEKIEEYRQSAKRYLKSKQYKFFTKEYFAEMVFELIQDNLANFLK